MNYHLVRNSIKNLFEINSEQNTLLNKFNKTNEIKPNIMQEEALMSLRQLRESGEHKGLVISATELVKLFYVHWM